jgi:hypothetical protein
MIIITSTICQYFFRHKLSIILHHFPISRRILLQNLLHSILFNLHFHCLFNISQHLFSVKLSLIFEHSLVIMELLTCLIKSKILIFERIWSVIIIWLLLSLLHLFTWWLCWCIIVDVLVLDCFLLDNNLFCFMLQIFILYKSIELIWYIHSFVHVHWVQRSFVYLLHGNEPSFTLFAC